MGVLPPHMKKSLTYDRGSEMSAHKWFTEITGIPVYFADPYSPWQRGTNENTNGLIRDYLPKKTDFREVGDEELMRVQHELNLRPRKGLDYFDPAYVFNWFCQQNYVTIHDFYASQYQIAL
jgi:IS30 family transposase